MSFYKGMVPVRGLVYFTENLEICIQIYGTLDIVVGATQMTEKPWKYRIQTLLTSFCIFW